MEENIEIKIRYLEMIQGIITRMSTNSFALKGWAVTLVAGIFALASKESDKIYFLIAYVPLVIFWFLDSYYLQLERKYRKLYEESTQKQPNEIDFQLKVPQSNIDDKTLYLQCFISRTECGFYFPSALLVALITIISQ